MAGDTLAPFKTDKVTTQTAALLTQRFGTDRVNAALAVMGGEDFSRFYLAGKSIARPGGNAERRRT